MCFFKDGKGRVNRLGLNVFGGRAPAAVLSAEERPRSVAILLFMLVLLLHLWAALELLKPRARPAKIKPVTIEVSLQAAPAPAPEKVPAKKAPPPPVPPIAKPKPVKPPTPPVKAPPRKKAPVVRKQAELPKPAAAEAPPAPLPPAAEPAIMNKPIAPAPPAAVAAPAKPAPKAAPPVKENEHATCVSCPKVQYPVMAQRRGWEGSVLLKLQLSPDGRAENVTVLRSSGHGALDEAAIANAKASRFSTGNAGEIRQATKLFEFKLK